MSKRWTIDEDTRLRDIYSQSEGLWVSLDDIAELIGRTRWGVAMRASRLGLGDYTRKKPGGRKDRRKFKGDAVAVRRHLSITTRDWLEKDGHPRGFMDKHHSKETKEKISKASKRFNASLTKEQKSEIAQKAKQTMLKNYGTMAPLAFREGNMYSRTKGGKREDLDDMYFRSSWEANYARYLNFLKDNGDIQGWEFEPETFMFHEIKRGTREYTPDFKIFENDGRVVYHEIKGWMDAKSKTKLKRMAKYYPEEVVIVVGEDEYKEISKQVRNLIPNWEINKGI